ncbi:MAG: hypothetical protein LBU92_01505 [Prevotellaceae bacterium]|jgi:hypothetical protein|nr:hypothetical protein [Prevotellaceae bacterium]
MLEQFVNNHRPEFDSEEPAAGHVLRFAKRMKAAKVKHYRLRYLSAAAAVALLLVGVGIFYQQQKCPMSEEMREVQQHYGKLLLLEQEKLNAVLAKVDAQTRKEVMSDVRQMLSESAISTNNLLCYEKSNPTVVAALVTEYTSKIEQLQLLEQVLQSNEMQQEV